MRILLCNSHPLKGEDHDQGKSNKTSVTLGGAPITLFGEFPQVGQTAPAFTLVDKDLKDVSLKDFTGKRKILNIVPSLDTPTCATSTRKFNETANKLDNTVILVISADLPFAMSRFCGAEGLNNVTTLSLMRVAISCATMV